LSKLSFKTFCADGGIFVYERLDVQSPGNSTIQGARAPSALRKKDQGVSLGKGNNSMLFNRCNLGWSPDYELIYTLRPYEIAGEK
jgi:hypothetical protein